MKKTITLSTALFLSFCGYSQSISFERDTIQVLQNSDVGIVAGADIDMDGDIDILITGNGPGTGVSTTLQVCAYTPTVITNYNYTRKLPAVFGHFLQNVYPSNFVFL